MSISKKIFYLIVIILIVIISIFTRCFYVNSIEKDIEILKAHTKSQLNKSDVAILFNINTMLVYFIVNEKGAISYEVEPGSILKIVTAIVYLKKFIEPPVYYCNGIFPIFKDNFKNIRLVREDEKNFKSGDYLVCSDLKGHGKINLQNAIGYSCSNYFYNLMESIDYRDFYETLLSFGFGQKTNIYIPNIKTEEKEGKIEKVLTDQLKLFASVGSGGNIYVTPIQVCVFYSAIFNGGNIITPTYYQTNKSINITPKIVSTLNIEREARFIKEGLYLCLTEGTGKNAKIPNIKMYGKTGTIYQNRKSNKRDGWFIVNIENEHNNIGFLLFCKNSTGYQAAMIAKKILLKLIDTSIF